MLSLVCIDGETEAWGNYVTGSGLQNALLTTLETEALPCSHARYSKGSVSQGCFRAVSFQMVQSCRSDTCIRGREGSLGSMACSVFSLSTEPSASYKVTAKNETGGTFFDIGPGRKPLVILSGCSLKSHKVMSALLWPTRVGFVQGDAVK